MRDEKLLNILEQDLEAERRGYDIELRADHLSHNTLVDIRRRIIALSEQIDALKLKLMDSEERKFTIECEDRRLRERRYRFLHRGDRLTSVSSALDAIFRQFRNRKGSRP
jgi:hypothetical protein